MPSAGNFSKKRDRSFENAKKNAEVLVRVGNELQGKYEKQLAVLDLFHRMSAQKKLAEFARVEIIASAVSWLP